MRHEECGGGDRRCGIPGFRFQYNQLGLDPGSLTLRADKEPVPVVAEEDRGGKLFACQSPQGISQQARLLIT
jgi:hypothetical protein